MPEIPTTGTAGKVVAVALADSPGLDAFSRLRVGLPQLRLSAIFDTDLRPLIWDTALTAGGTATHLPNEYSVAMQVSASGDEVIRQTKEYFVYRAGQSQLVFCTFHFGDPDANVTAEAGYYDADDGVFICRKGTEVSMHLRTSTSGAPVDALTAQADWNLDKLDGTGPSGITLDLTKTQILVLDLQWLGVGRVRCGFDIDGKVYYCHEYLNANTHQTTVYMKRAKLPVRYRLVATGAPSATYTMRQICATVIREGGSNEPSVQHEARSSGSVNVGQDWETVIGVRLRAINLRATMRLVGATVYNEDGSFIEYAAIMNPTYSGTPTWLTIDNDSATEVSRFNAAISVTGAGDPDGGHVFPLGGFVAGGGNKGTAPSVSVLSETVPVVADIAGNRDEVWIIARGDASADVRGLIVWAEER